MNRDHPAIFQALSGILAAGILAIPMIAYAATRPTPFEVTLDIRDDEGHPIPYATVWEAIEFDKGHLRAGRADQFLSCDDLWRITMRYSGLHHVISNFGDKPVPALHVPRMGDASGRFRTTVDYENSTGEGNHYVRPEPLTVCYTVMKQGYAPARIDFRVKHSDSSVVGNAVLRREGKSDSAPAPYLEAFERARFELSDSVANTEISASNARRLERVHGEMADAANQAKSAGDRAMAATIVARMRTFPRVAIVPGRGSGFSQGDRGSVESQQLLNTCYELDPDGLYVWMNTITERSQLPVGASQEDRIRAGLKQLEALIERYGDAVWPELYLRRASSYAEVGEYEKARMLLLEASRMEPRFTDWGRKIEAMKRRMVQLGKRVPADW